MSFLICTVGNKTGNSKTSGSFSQIFRLLIHPSEKRMISTDNEQYLAPNKITPCILTSESEEQATRSPLMVSDSHVLFGLWKKNMLTIRLLCEKHLRKRLALGLITSFCVDKEIV